MHRSSTTLSWRVVAGLGACVVGLTGLTGPALAPAAHASPSDPATSTSTSTSSSTSTSTSTSDSTAVAIASAALEVTLDRDFPQVLGYRDVASGATLGGQPDPVRSITVNGTPRTAEATVTTAASSAAYRVTFPDLPGVGIELTVSVEGHVLTWRVTKVTDSDKVVVGTIDVPGLDLVSVSSAQPGATSAFTTIDTNSTRNADVIRPVTGADAPQSAPVGAAYGILNTAQLAASVETNGTYDKPTGATRMDNGRLWHQLRAAADGTRRVGITPGQWTVRGDGAPEQSELPWAKVVVTADRNDDSKVDWQDGAVAFREIAHVPAGSAQVPDRVVQRIPFNFSSLATHPFLRTLDDTKRISLATDGLGQFALLKGYAAEGHDSAHPDYGGNYNERAGGLKDLNTLLVEGDKWGADFGVHVNATEAYAEARAFSEKLVDKSAPGWNWLNQAYYINQRPDLTSGDLLARTQRLHDETRGNLDFLYWDVYWGFGWIPDSMNAALREQGWQMGSEWAYTMERDNIWAHWAVDRNYGGASNKGVNSTIVRFIRNAQKDVWNPHPVLGGSTIVEAEGWTAHRNWNALMTNVWTNQLPTKFLQHFDITKWSSDKDGSVDIHFTDGVRGTDASGTRRLFVGGAKVLDGDSYLLPWGETSPSKPTKAYHWNAKGGTTTWQLPDSLRGASSFSVHQLGETGRTRIGTVANRDGTVTLTAKPGTAYVLYPATVPTQADPQYGQGTLVKDPGFNAKELDVWNPKGDVTQEHLPTGQRVVQLGAGGASSIAQELTGLSAGKRYAASAWVQVQPGGSRATTLSITGDGVDASNTIQRSTVTNSEASNELKGTSYQRVRVIFTAPRSGRALLRVAVASGKAAVQVDDVRVVPTTEAAPAGTVVAQQDYEGVDQGWLPFVSGPAQSGGDARTHIARIHAPYTQAGWNGKLVDDVLDGEWSLKAHEEASGLVYRTWAGTLPFEPGHRYRVEFDYQNATAGAYSFVTGVDQVADGRTTTAELTTTTFGRQRTTKRFSQELTTGACGDAFIGLRRHPVGGTQADFILDNLRVTDLGAAETPGACARLEVTGPSSGLVPGEANAFTTTFTNHEEQAAADVTVKTTWRVVVPATTQPGSHQLTGRAAYGIDGVTRTVESAASFTTLPPGKIPQSRLSIGGVSDTEPGSGDGSPAAAIDGKASTMWHSAWSTTSEPAPYPHWITVDLGEDYAVDGFDYQVRVGNGSMKEYELYVSTDNRTWGDPVTKGTFASTADVQHLEFTAKQGRYVKLVGLSSINGAPYGGASELNVWGLRVNEPPTALPKAGMSIHSFDSQELEGENGAATNAIDEDPSTIWHTEWYAQVTGYPHHIAVDLGASHDLTAISVQGRPTGSNGRIKDYEVYVSSDGTSWGQPVAKGTFTETTAPQMVRFAGPTTARYVKVVGLNAINGLPFAAVAELQFYVPTT
ncbi:endo-alpha-N-acetylgalactosaminidase family protein [Intrasporangium sp. DVR]|uniref:endo-alpha-N-acetylgalactosaminidase family protein n=1 Tax=Intrasporangium sp. DVR TaxID=3127867 RepID=UPI00313A4E08